MDIPSIRQNIIMSLGVFVTYFIPGQIYHSLSVWQVNSCRDPLLCIKKILHYLKGTINFGLVYEKGDIPDEMLIGFSDSDLAGDLSDGRSTAGMAFYVNNCLVSRNSQKQKAVALSSCEAEYMVTTMAACHALWLSRLLAELVSEQLATVKILLTTCRRLH
jgi:hypothetical protein